MHGTIHTWVTRLLLIFGTISVILICNATIKCYQALSVEAILEDYVLSMKSGYVEEFDIIQSDCGKYGYENTQITITRIDPNTKVRTSHNTKEILNVLLSSPNKRYELEQWDLIHITSSNGTSTVQASWVYRAEDRAY